MVEEVEGAEGRVEVAPREDGLFRYLGCVHGVLARDVDGGGYVRRRFGLGGHG